LHFWVAFTESLTIPMAGLSAFRRNCEVMLNSNRRCYPSALALVTLASSSTPREEATGAKVKPGDPAPAIGPGINRWVGNKAGERSTGMLHARAIDAFAGNVKGFLHRLLLVNTIGGN
jgi:hypothetical protein